MLAAICALALIQPDGLRATRYEMGERLKRLDVAWLATSDSARRARAVPHISSAVTGFFSTQYAPACRSLDLAAAALEGRTILPEDAIDVRFDPPYVEPGDFARLRITWAYRPTPADPVTVRVAGKQVRVAVGEGATLEVDLSLPFPDVGREQEVSVLVPISVGSLTASAYVSKVKQFEGRVKLLEEAKNPISRDLASTLRQVIEGRAEQDSPVLETLFAAEELENEEVQLDELTKLALVRHQGASFSVVFPQEIPDRPVVMIAMHGAGGSENLFLEGYGRGRAALASLQRGWIFVSPRTSAASGAAALNWLREVRKIEPQVVLAMGHSMGAGIALQSSNWTPRPSAIALFAPAAAQIPEALAGTPIFLAVGKDELAPLLTMARRLGDDLKARPKSQFREYAACEHLMIVAEATADAYRFFDGVLRDDGQRASRR